MKRGIALSIAAAVISGCSIFANSIFVTKTDPLIFTIVRNCVVSILLTAVLLAAGQIQHFGHLSRRQWAQLVTIGIIGGGIPFALFFTGLREVGAFNGNMIQKTLFLWVALLAVPILHERISRIQLIGYSSLFLGMFVFGGTVSVVNKTGTWLILLATILWAIENVFAKVALKSIPVTIVSWGRMVFGLPCLVLAAMYLGKAGLLTHIASYAAIPIVVSSALLTLYVTVWYSALAKAPATLVSSVLVFAPVVTAILSSAVMHKPIVGTQVVNLILLTVGTLLVVLERILPKKQALNV